MPPQSEPCAFEDAFGGSDILSSIFKVRSRRGALQGKVRSQRLTCLSLPPPPRPPFLTPTPQVGEGTFAEVYAAVAPSMPKAWRENNVYAEGKEAAMAFKVMPIDGDVHINDEPQKTPDEMMSEVVATLELSKLANSSAPSFIRALSVSICRGAYPAELLDAWDLWKEDNAEECENERPVCCCRFSRLSGHFLFFFFFLGGSFSFLALAHAG